VSCATPSVATWPPAGRPGRHNISGVDEFATSAAVASHFFPAPNAFGIATGLNYPDALSGGVYMTKGSRLGPMLLVNTNAPLPPSIAAYLAGLPVEPGHRLRRPAGGGRERHPGPGNGGRLTQQVR